MKATGIVRRVDDLGRIVIPKEIRRTLRIREGDPLEIYTEKDGGVVFLFYWLYYIGNLFLYKKEMTLMPLYSNIQSMVIYKNILQVI